MRSAATTSIVLIMILLTAVAPAMQLQTDAARVITAEEINLSGLTRVSDILGLALELDALTVDGFNWQFEPAGHFPDFRSEWILLLDGQRLELGRFGYPALNSLPVNADQIERIEIFTTPMIFHAGIATRGMIHIHTTDRLDRNGFTGLLQYSAGNETGDPGPYRYTDYNSRNVDHIGADRVARSDFQYGGNYTRLSLFAANHFPTDETAYHRNRDIFRENFAMQEVVGGLLKSSLEGGNNRLTILIGHFQSEDLLYFEPAAGEVPLKENWTHCGLNGQYPVTSKSNILFTTSYTHHELGDWYSPSFPSFDWQSGYLRSNAALVHRNDNLVKQITVELTHRQAYAEDFGSYGLTRLTMCGSAKKQFGTTASSAFAVELQTGESGNGGTILLGAKWQPQLRQKLSLVLSAAVQPQTASAGFLFWTEQGYNFLDSNSIPCNDNYTSEARSHAALDAGWRLDRKSFQLHLNGRYLFIDRFQLYRQNYQYNVLEDSFSSPLDIHPDQKGQSVSGGVRFSWHPGSSLHQAGEAQSRITQTLEWRCQYFLSGTTLFSDHFRRHPAHKISITTLYRHHERLSLTLSIAYRSQTSWQDYQQAIIDAGELYSAPVPGATTWDVAVHKLLWGPRLNCSLLVRNIFNAPDLYHPLGAHFDLSFFLRLVLKFGYM